MSDSEGPGQGPRICMSKEFPNDADTARLGTTLGESLLFHIEVQTPDFGKRENEIKEEGNFPLGI